jgi:glycosyltransferase involved in cell wall biosynthesis
MDISKDTAKPLLSVLMITYKHQSFIREAVEGVLNQEVTFPIELIIADDNSPDDTSQIVNDIKNSHPQGALIKYIKHDRNIGMMDNAMFILNISNAKYIALCEGDDYWIDKYKLQKQVDFLENNSNVSMCGHYVALSKNGLLTYPTLPIEHWYIPKFKISTSFQGPQTLSMVYRNEISLPVWVKKIYGVDRALVYLNSLKGDVVLMNFIGAVYRVHSGGIEHLFKKDKFSLPFRNITEDKVYYQIVDDKYAKRQLF